jgi:hypothetical protein
MAWFAIGAGRIMGAAGRNAGIGRGAAGAGLAGAGLLFASAGPPGISAKSAPAIAARIRLSRPNGTL